MNYNVWNRIVWSKPEMPRPALCSVCFGRIADDEVPIMMWATDGRFAQFCENCQDEIMPLLVARREHRRGKS